MNAASPRPTTDQPVGLLVRLRLAFAGITGAVAGVAPHVLHHVGPIAGTAVVSGATGTLVFGALGFLLMVPTLLRIKRHFGSWVAPGIATAVFALIFTISTVWVGPIIRGEPAASTDEHSTDHDIHPSVTATTAPR